MQAFPRSVCKDALRIRLNASPLGTARKLPELLISVSSMENACFSWFARFLKSARAGHAGANSHAIPNRSVESGVRSYLEERRARRPRPSYAAYLDDSERVGKLNTLSMKTSIEPPAAITI